MSTRKFSLLAFVLAAALPVGVQAANGTVQFAEAAWITTDKGGAVIARRGSVVEPGSTVSTVADGYAQWQASDGGSYLLGADSSLTVENYRYPQEEGRSYGKGMVKLALGSGSARVLTGSIANNHPKGFVMKTPNGTISLPDEQGTDYTATYCNEKCPEFDGETLPAGLWVAVNEGAITVSNSPGVRAGKGQFIHVPIGGHPKLVEKAPNVLLRMALVWKLDDFSMGHNRLDTDASVRIEPSLPASPTLP